MEKQKRKTLRLAVLGVGLKAAGAICMMASAVAAMEGTKQIILKELYKQLETV